MEDLLAKTEANKELHNKQRLASSYSNFARSRTVADKTCSFPANFLGCDLGEYAGTSRAVQQLELFFLGVNDRMHWPAPAPGVHRHMQKEPRRDVRWQPHRQLVHHVFKHTQLLPRCPWCL